MSTVKLGKMIDCELDEKEEKQKKKKSKKEEAAPVAEEEAEPSEPSDEVMARHLYYDHPNTEHNPHSYHALHLTLDMTDLQNISG